MKTLAHPWLATLLLSLTAQHALADRLVDPTRPANAKAVSTRPSDVMRLEAIMRSGDRYLAIVNGKVVRAGDSIGAWRIEDVAADSVSYTHAGKRGVARLQDKSISVRRNVVTVASHEEQP